MFKIAKVVFPYPIEEEYDYIIPTSLQEQTEVGKRVEVELKTRIEEGMVISTYEISFLDPTTKYKEIQKVLDSFPIINQEQIQLSYWMADYYLCEVGEALDKMYPKPCKLTQKDLKEIQKQTVETIHTENLVSLSEEQKTVFEDIQKTLDIQKPSLHLIHGITGSGKTEIYLYLIVEVLKRNKGVLFLVPEISITVQMIQRVRKIVGNHLSILHSNLTDKERFKEYVKILNQKAPVVLGTRSAVFAPISNLGLIIIDEEHDSSYREHSHPRYDAKEVARKRSELNRIPLVLGSATPRIEIRYETQKYNHQEINETTYRLHFLKKRILGRLPEVYLIERENSDQPISNQLLNEIEINAKNKKQTLILLNRRGYHPYLYCKNCKKNISCPNCSISLSLHKEHDGFSLKCHYCNHQQLAIQRCPDCGGKLIKLGTGIQKVEEFLLRVFPNLRIERLDTDVIHREKVLNQVIQEFIDGKIDILTGTQMISKGIDAPNLSLVGVLQADAGLYLSDYRSSERTFSLLVQVAGRSGRRDNSGRVFLEVMDKDNFYIQWALKQDYESFYKWELSLRKEFHYPPFVRLIRLLVRSSSKERSLKFIRLLSEHIESIKRKNGNLYEIVGPSPAPIFRLHDKYRYHVLIKTQEFHQTINQLKDTIKNFKKKLSGESYLEIEIDPIDIF
ncbi:MAG: primosomal protein N' [Leptospiraceae bacterium]|nr:primosomal protein N' [Leptospiraceae bacterium]MDW7976096.1 primosomal protein N' [Leptospiraceae bacterium]